jgi:hypothetical protein
VRGVVSRINTGWRLAKASFVLMRDDKKLLVFPLLSTMFIAIALALTLTPGLVWSESADRDWIVLPFMLVGGYLTVFFAVYFNVALAAATVRSMDGQPGRVSDGLAVARERRGVIARWAVLSFAIGVLTRVGQRLLGETAGGVLAGLMLGAVALGWTVATFFAVPLLALEGLGPKETLKRSASLVRERWGEGLVGYTAISTAVLLLAAFPLLVFLQIVLGVIDVDTTAGAIVGVIWCISVIAACTIGSALGVVFRVELYRYSTEDRLTGRFPQADVAAAFGPPRAETA